MRQQLTALRLRLTRRQDGLRVKGEGRLAPLGGDHSRSLGPQLRFVLEISRAWILARGLPLPRFWQEWKRDHPGDTAW
jgi:hypothetical protein